MRPLRRPPALKAPCAPVRAQPNAPTQFRPTTALHPRARRRAAPQLAVPRQTDRSPFAEQDRRSPPWWMRVHIHEIRAECDVTPTPEFQWSAALLQPASPFADSQTKTREKSPRLERRLLAP